MERSILKKRINKAIQIILPVLLGIAILVWTYYDFDFSRVSEVFFGGMNHWWMLFSLVFGVTAQLFRGWRWALTLEPLGERPRKTNCVYAVFICYAANLVVPRLGEVSRCGILTKYEGISFAKSLGTVVTERLIDTLCILLLTGTTILLQSSMFSRFFRETGTDVTFIRHLFTSTNFFITLLCLGALGILVLLLLRHLSIYSRLKRIVGDIWQGCLSLRYIRHKWLFALYTIGIWGSYFLHFYVAFFAFDFSAGLGMMSALVMFVVGSIAVIVPTPNGAGPWHFVIITLMMMYGVTKGDAGAFALLVHGIQTFLLILLGIYGLAALPLANKKQ